MDTTTTLPTTDITSVFNYSSSTDGLQLVQNQLSITQLNSLISSINSTGPLSSINIAVDTLTVDVAELVVNTFLLKIIARKIVIACSGSPVFFMTGSNPSSIVIMTGSIVASSTNTARPVLQVCYQGNAPLPLVCSSSNMISIFMLLSSTPTAFTPQASSVQNIISLWTEGWPVQNILKAQFLNARQQYFSGASSADTGNIFYWVSWNAGALSADPDMAQIQHEAASIAATWGAGRMGSRFVPLLSQDVFLSQLNALISIVASYETQIQTLQTQELVQQDFAAFSSALASAAQNAAYPLFTQLKVDGQQHDALMVQFSTAKLAVSASKDKVTEAFTALKAALAAKQAKEEIMMGIEIGLAVVQVSILIGGMLVAPEAAGPGIEGEGTALESEATTAEADLEEEKEAAEDEVPTLDQILEGGTLGNLFAEGGEEDTESTEKAIGGLGSIVSEGSGFLPDGIDFASVVKGMEKMKNLAKAANTFWTISNNYLTSLQTPGAPGEYSVNSDSSLDSFADTANNDTFYKDNYDSLMLNDSIDGYDPATYWDIQLTNTKTSLADISEAADYIGAYTVMVSNIKNYYALMSQLVDLRSKAFVTYTKLQSEIKTQETWQSLVTANMSAAQLTQASIQLLTNKNSKIKFSVCKAFQDYNAAYYYCWMQENPNMMNMTDNSTQLLSTLNSSQVEISYILSGSTSATTVAIPLQDFQNVTFTIPASAVAITGTAPNQQLSWAITPDTISAAFSDSKILYITDAKFFMQGLSTPGDLTINTSGVYNMIAADGTVTVFSGSGLSLDFIYESPTNIITSWTPASQISQFYMKPSPFTQWNMKINKPMDLTAFTGIQIILTGYYLK